MKILSAEQTRLADAHTIAHEPILSIELMERASTRFIEAFYQNHDPKNSIAVVCGTGNNGGDGLAISRILLNKGYKVQPFVIQPKLGGSADFLKNLPRLESLGQVFYIKTQEEIPDFSKYKTIIDAIFGSGLSRNISGLYADVIHAMNKTSAKIVAVDIPSGMFVDAHTSSEAIVQAHTTISFQVPKLSFFMPENYKYVGDWQVVDIGLDQEYIDSLTVAFSTIEVKDVEKMLPGRKKFDHKGIYGHGQLFGGSYGKMGAITLAAKAFLRTGAGLLTVTIPKTGVDIMQSTVPEAMVLEQPGNKHIEHFNLQKGVTAIGIGPGLGTDKDTSIAMANFLRENNIPLILDADALNIISNNRELLPLLLQDTILTPHIKEFDRLAGPSANHWQRIEKAIALAKKWQILIVLKGAHTAIVNHDGQVWFNTTGNPGMATGGSGDVLLGIITSFRTQGLPALAAAIAGTFIHGQAGDVVATKKSMTSLLAGDIIEALGDVFLRFNR